MTDLCCLGLLVTWLYDIYMRMKFNNTFLLRILSSGHTWMFREKLKTKEVVKHRCENKFLKVKSWGTLPQPDALGLALLGE